jgi:tRNA-dihydrouridine synthase A
VERLKRDAPGLEIIVNGGITTLEQAETHLACFDGVMIGRAAYQNPYLLAEVDRRVFGTSEPVVSRQVCIEALIPYLERELAQGTRLHSMLRHVLGLFHGAAGGRRWRRYLSENGGQPGVAVRSLLEAANRLTDECPGGD